MTNERKTPHPYQKIAISKTVNALKKKAGALVVMATGLGKTIVSCFTVEKFLKKPSDRVLFLCHEKGILSQNKKEYMNFFGDEYTYADFFGSKKNWDADQHNFVFATFQSLRSHLFKSDRKNIFAPKHFDYIIVDESHHAKAETFDEVLNYFQATWELGITATPDREDGSNIRDRFGKEVVNYLLPKALGKGWLTKVNYKLMSDGIDQETIDALVQEVLVENMRITEKQLNERLFIKKRTEEQVKGILTETAGSKKAIIFCANIAHLRHVAKLIPNSAVITSAESDNDNDQALKDYIAGNIQHILVVDKFNEGMDVPDTDVLVFLRSTESYRIWLQQLGRGLRRFPGKEVVTVLDFVGNVQRVQNVKTLFNQISEFSNNKSKNLSDELVLHEALHLDGGNFSFDFTSEIVDLLKVIDIMDLGFYSTWQEASDAFKSLRELNKISINTYDSYKQHYKKDPRLPSNPNEVYSDFPMWYRFLGKEEPAEPYETIDECMIAIKKIQTEGKVLLSTYGQYKLNYKIDPKLPSNPEHKYSDFKSWKKFLGKGEKVEKYKTLEDCRIAVKKIEEKFKIIITSSSLYYEHYKKDPKLPHKIILYDGFTSWYDFLEKEKPTGKYKTCLEASMAAIALGFETGEEYKERYTEDPRLPENISSFYPDFPGWDKFLRKISTGPYETCKEASEAAIALGFETGEEYSKGYKQDPRLNSSPGRKYSDFPGWDKFLGKEPKDLYKTCKEASEAAIALGFETGEEYKERYTEDPRLPSSPNRYPDFPGWDKFLKKQPIKRYSTCKEASEAVIGLRIESRHEYYERYKEDPKLFRHPEIKYSDFPGWNKFLGKE